MALLTMKPTYLVLLAKSTYYVALFTMKTTYWDSAYYEAYLLGSACYEGTCDLRMLPTMTMREPVTICKRGCNHT